ncbi:MAG: tetratricopeptide repeat protein [Puniceicoccaceae bacterium]
MPLRILHCWALALSCLLASPSPELFGQPDPASMAITPLQETAAEYAERNDFLGARPFLLEIAARLSDGSKEERESLGPIYFFLGLGYLQEYSSEMDAELLREAISAFTRGLEAGVTEEREIRILEFRGDAYRGLGEFENAAADYETILEPPLSRRLDRPAKEREVLEKLSLSLHALRDWDRAVPWLRRFVDQAVGDEQKALAAGLLLEAYIEQDNTSAILELLPLITVDNPSRYSVSLNIALMKAGDKLADRSRYAEAALLYNATLNRDQIIRYFEERVAALEARVERLRAMGSSEERMADDVFELEEARRQLEAIREVEPYTSELMARVARNYYLAGRDYEAIWAYLRFVEKFPDDPIADDFRFSAFITATKVGLEDLARRLGEELLAGEGDNEEFRKRVLLSLASAYMETGDEARFLETAEKFSEEFGESPEAEQVVFLLGNYLLNEGKLDELIDRFTLMLPNMEGNPGEDGIYYWMGLAHLFEARFAEARSRFEKLIADFPGSAYREDATYRLAMTYYGEDDVEKAKEAFESFIETYPEGSLRGEVEFFLGEVAASEGKLIEAIQHYDRVPEHTDNIDYITSAFFQKARILERNDILKRAARTYEEYIDEYGETGKLTAAIFRLGEVFREMGRPGDALISYRDAILRYGNDPENLGVDSMIETYVRRYDETLARLQATVDFLEKLSEDDDFRVKLAENRGFLYQQFADDPDLDDALYEELRQSEEFSKDLARSAEPVGPYLESYRAQLEAFPEETPEEVFSRTFAEARQRGERTLAMRMEMALRDLGSPPRDPLVIQEQDLDLASPKILVWIGEGRERIDPDLAKAAYRRAIEHEENVPEKVDAYLSLADMLMEEGETDEALGLYREAEENFPADPGIYRALVSQARVYAERGQQEDARERLMQILKTPDWRGEPHAEALYRVGMTYFEEGKYPDAHGFFERAFIGYETFDEWAARSYLMDARTLVEMGDTEGARNTLREAIEKDRYRDTEIYGELVEYANTL